MENNFIEISVILPICLHLDERTFYIPYKKETNIEITTSNFFGNQYSTIGKAQNAEVESDTFSQFRFTNLRIKFHILKMLRLTYSSCPISIKKYSILIIINLLMHIELLVTGKKLEILGVLMIS